MKIEKLAQDHIRIKDATGTLLDLYTLPEGGLQVISSECKDLTVEERKQYPRSVIVREK